MTDHILEERLIDFLDGLTPDEESSSIRMHLEACPECRQAAEEIGSADEFVKTELSPDPELFATEIPDSISRIMDRVERSLVRDADPGRQGSRVLFLFRKAAVSLAAGIVLALTLFYFFENPPTPSFAVEIDELEPTSVSRSADERYYYIEFVPNFTGYLYVMDLFITESEPGWSLLLIFPDFGAEPGSKMHVAMPFQKGDKIRLPPGDVGYEVDQPAETEYLFLIPSRIPLDEGTLQEAVSELKKEISSEDSSLEEKKETILARLEDRYPGTMVKSFRLE